MSADINSVRKDTSRVNSGNLQDILEIVDKINFGSITLIIQDEIIVQVDRHEKIRIK